MFLGLFYYNDYYYIETDKFNFDILSFILKNRPSIMGIKDIIKHPCYSPLVNRVEIEKLGKTGGEDYEELEK